MREHRALRMRCRLPMHFSQWRTKVIASNKLNQSSISYTYVKPDFSLNKEDDYFNRCDEVVKHRFFQ